MKSISLHLTATLHTNYFISILFQRRSTLKNTKKPKNTDTTEIRYPFSNQLFFALVMEDEQLCKELLERIFQGQHIKEVKILDKVSAKSEASIVTGVSSKSVRMDVLFEDKTSWFNIEMQVENRKDLPFSQPVLQRRPGCQKPEKGRRIHLAQSKLHNLYLPVRLLWQG